MAALGHIGNLFAVRRLGREVLDLRVESRNLARDLRDEIFALGERRFEAPKPSASLSCAMGNVGEARIRLDPASFGCFVPAFLCGFLVDRLVIGLLDRREIGFEMNQRFLGFLDEAGFACQIGIKLLGTRFEFAGAFGGASRFALKIFLLYLEARQRRSLDRLSFAQRR